MKNIEVSSLQRAWSKILKDSEARRALERLRRGGFAISHLTPCDATFRHANWADYIAGIPFLPNRPSRRQIHRKAILRRHWPVVRAMRRLAQKMSDLFCELR